ncbi:hypothetical protein ACFLUJ_08815 [Chloroflexota bacterium]
MADLETYLLIGILRTAGIKQDSIADAMKCGNKLVIEADRWFRQCQQRDLEDLVVDARMRQVVAERLPGLGAVLQPDEVVPAAQVTADRLFLYYGRIPRAKSEVPQLAGLDHVVGPVYGPLLQEHWRQLSQLASTLQDGLFPPSIEAFFNDDIDCRLHHAVESGNTLQSGISWRMIGNTPFEVGASARTSSRKLRLMILAESDHLFARLTTHLGFEFSFDSEYEAWKKQMVPIAKFYLDVAGKIVRDCPSRLGMDYQPPDQPTGLTYQVPVFIGQFIIGNPYPDALPGLEVKLQSDKFLRLVSVDSPARTLAIGNKDQVETCRDLLLKEIKRRRQLKIFSKIRSGLVELEGKSEHLRGQLDLVISRGFFKGTCPVCHGYFSGAADTS